MSKQGNLDFDEIFEITEVSEEDTYDFVIPETHCFFANGILVHNSGNLEENADLVLGLWRADKESPDCRVECLKGRDVGTFVSWLRFDTQIQKFYDSAGPQTSDQAQERNYMDK
jgi:hypothetical protein